MSQQIIKCQSSPSCVRTTRHGWDATHRDTLNRKFYIAECGGCGCMWPVCDVADTVNAACSPCDSY